MGLLKDLNAERKHGYNDKEKNQINALERYHSEHLKRVKGEKDPLIENVFKLNNGYFYSVPDAVDKPEFIGKIFSVKDEIEDEFVGCQAFKDIDGYACTYQGNRESRWLGKGKPVDPQNLMIEELKKWLVRVSQYSFEKAATEVSSKIQYLAKIQGDLIFQSQLLPGKSNETFMAFIANAKKELDVVSSALQDRIKKNNAIDLMRKAGPEINNVLNSYLETLFYIFRHRKDSTPEHFVSSELLNPVKPEYTASFKTMYTKILGEIYNNIQNTNENQILLKLDEFSDVWFGKDLTDKFFGISSEPVIFEPFRTAQYQSMFNEHLENIKKLAELKKALEDLSKLSEQVGNISFLLGDKDTFAYEDSMLYKAISELETVMSKVKKMNEEIQRIEREIRGTVNNNKKHYGSSGINWNSFFGKSVAANQRLQTSRDKFLEISNKINKAGGECSVETIKNETTSLASSINKRLNDISTQKSLISYSNTTSTQTSTISTTTPLYQNTYQDDVHIRYFESDRSASPNQALSSNSMTTGEAKEIVKNIINQQGTNSMSLKQAKQVIRNVLNGEDETETTSNRHSLSVH